jgi:hypothetical protein
MAVVMIALVSTLVITPAGAHVGGTVGHLWTTHLKPLAVKAFYTKAQSNERFVNVGESENWRQVGAAGQPGFTFAWANFGSVHNTVAFYKDPLGVVHLRGIADCSHVIDCEPGTGSATIFILPPGYRPVAQEAFPMLTSASGANPRVDVTSSGAVVLRNPRLDDSGDWLSLDGITFRAD